jgi:hypothetical protein
MFSGSDSGASSQALTLQSHPKTKRSNLFPGLSARGVISSLLESELVIMLIKAPVTCRCLGCGHIVETGETVEYTKGTPLRHPTCVGKPALARTTRLPEPD